MRKQPADRGSVSLELVILAPVIIAVIGILFFATRNAQAGNSVTDIADAAARTASLERTPQQAKIAAENEARIALNNTSLVCESMSVSVDVEGFTTTLGATGSVETTVSCSVKLTDLTGIPALPGSHTLTRTGLSPIDPWRQRR
ncbi:TadE/TadG family type IV pilus assembly protein [Brevibacterium casei]|uniref:TadE/TadG family type IV pilus assembly protein n=1 Tax=Brevibacterium casei TaxID=33889 RepID=UPI00223BEAF7|nr:TadE/TadG family type IV pilus assembly protein [Brevibacterium casei]MCT1549664.1 pilus assembly protein [Brevibacterium casei]MCT1559201.1 pilus assembly protein [Brevibacterium casei]MCT2207629.1 pilus assembly protein [Brevibacterium casei]